MEQASYNKTMRKEMGRIFAMNMFALCMNNLKRYVIAIVLMCVSVKRSAGFLKKN